MHVFADSFCIMHIFRCFIKIERFESSSRWLRAVPAQTRRSRSCSCWPTARCSTAIPSNHSLQPSSRWYWTSIYSVSGNIHNLSAALYSPSCIARAVVHDRGGEHTYTYLDLAMMMYVSTCRMQSCSTQIWKRYF